MSEIDRILDQLERDHTGDAWHGSPVSHILDGVTATQATARPIPGGHTIWELVLHMTAWKQEVRRRLTGARAGEPEDGDWPDVGQTTAKRWEDARSRLDSAHAALAAAVRALPESKLLEPTNDPRVRETGAGVSHYVLLHGLVQHDAYHAGQIAILKKALG
jgi:uncharacterized damage-inducible protein DinB